jgi:hypothetical protein
MKYVKKWNVKSHSSDKYYTVSMDFEGNYSCSCPYWIYRRKECKHIAEVKLQGGKVVKKAEYCLAKVNEPKIKNGVMLIPLIEIGDVHMEATIIYFMLRHGWTMSEVKNVRNLGKKINVRDVEMIIKTHGLKKYPDVY